MRRFILIWISAVMLVSIAGQVSAQAEHSQISSTHGNGPTEWAPHQLNGKGGMDLTGPYEWVPHWLKTVDSGRIIHPSTVFAESENRIFIGLNGTSPAPKPDQHEIYWAFNTKIPGSRVDHQVIVINRNGKVIEDWSRRWSQRLGFVSRIKEDPYDPEKHVWVIDRASQQILEFTNDGKKLVRAFGERGAAGDDDKHFNWPADICWLPDGTFFVADGFKNSRVVKFSKDGKYLTSWGTKGSGPGQFDLVEGVAVDAQHRVYVTDRGNGRVQIFNENGKYLEEWTGFIQPMKVLITPDQHVWVLDGAAARFLEYDLNGKLLDYWGVDADPDFAGINGGTYFAELIPGGLAWPHDFSIDPQGNLYVSDGRLWTIDKFIPRKDADRGRLMAPFK